MKPVIPVGVLGSAFEFWVLLLSVGDALFAASLNDIPDPALPNLNITENFCYYFDKYFK
jgi:hypothetical protein